MRINLLTIALFCAIAVGAQEKYRIPVSEADEKMQTGQYEPTWQSHNEGLWQVITHPDTLLPVHLLSSLSYHR